MSQSIKSSQIEYYSQYPGLLVSNLYQVYLSRNVVHFFLGQQQHLVQLKLLVLMFPGFLILEDESQLQAIHFRNFADHLMVVNNRLHL